MSVMELGALGEFLGVFALVATLIYLAIQVRQSRMQMKASTTQARSDSWVNLMSTRLASPELVDALLKEQEAPDTLTERDLFYIHSDLNMRTLSLENWFYQRSLGNLDPAMTTRLDRLMIYRSPVARAWWDRISERRKGLHPEFIAHVDAVLAKGDEEGWSL